MTDRGHCGTAGGEGERQGERKGERRGKDRGREGEKVGAGERERGGERSATSCPLVYQHTKRIRDFGIYQ